MPRPDTRTRGNIPTDTQASAQFSVDDTDTSASLPTSGVGAADGSGGLDDPYPYPTESGSADLPGATPTSGGGASLPVESGTTGGGGAGEGGGGAGGYTPVVKPSGLEFPVEACYPACTPLANDAEVSGLQLPSFAHC